MMQHFLVDALEVFATTNDISSCLGLQQ